MTHKAISNSSLQIFTELFETDTDKYIEHLDAHKVKAKAAFLLVYALALRFFKVLKDLKRVVVKSSTIKDLRTYKTHKYGWHC